MIVSIIGSNGLLSSAIGNYCNRNKISLNVLGRNVPKNHAVDNYIKLDLSVGEIDYDSISKSDLIIYAVGGGIQSKLKDDSSKIFHLNVFKPIEIFNSLKDKDFKGTFITFGSYFEIGENGQDHAFTEKDLSDSELKAPSDYSISKRMLTKFFSSTGASFKFYHLILPTIYGENEDPDRLIPYTLRCIQNASNLTFTAGDQVRQYIYINDVVEIIFDIINSKLHSGLYNIAGVEEFSVRDLVELLFELNSIEISPNVFGKEKRADVGMKILKLDGSKLFQSINYLPNTKIADVYDRYRFD